MKIRMPEADTCLILAVCSGLITYVLYSHLDNLKTRKAPMKRYDILHSHHRVDLITAVNDALALGWELHGATTAVRTDDFDGNQTAAFDYLQPMVKELTELDVIEGRK